MREFRAHVKAIFGACFQKESQEFQRFIRKENSSPVDGATRIALRLSRKGYMRGAMMAIAACIDLIEEEEKEFSTPAQIHPSEVSHKWERIGAFLRSRGLRFINLQPELPVHG